MFSGRLSALATKIVTKPKPEATSRHAQNELRLILVWFGAFAENGNKSNGATVNDDADKAKHMTSCGVYEAPEGIFNCFLFN